MSMWVGHDITAYGDRQAIGKFFNLAPENIHYIDHFDFSFGQKSVPGLRLGKLIEQNSDLIFLLKQSTDQILSGLLRDLIKNYVNMNMLQL